MAPDRPGRVGGPSRFWKMGQMGPILPRFPILTCGPLPLPIALYAIRLYSLYDSSLVFIDRYIPLLRFPHTSPPNLGSVSARPPLGSLDRPPSLHGRSRTLFQHSPFPGASAGPIPARPVRRVHTNRVRRHTSLPERPTDAGRPSPMRAVGTLRKPGTVTRSTDGVWNRRTRTPATGWAGATFTLVRLSAWLQGAPGPLRSSVCGQQRPSPPLTAEGSRSWPERRQSRLPGPPASPCWRAQKRA